MCAVLSMLVLFQAIGITGMAEEYDIKEYDNISFGESSLVNYPELVATYGTVSLTSDGIIDATIVLSFDSTGLIAEFYTVMSGVATVVGVKSIVISKQEWYGWKTVITSGGGEDSNKASHGHGILYSGAKAGDVYKASCVHYGTLKSNGVSYERPNETSGFTCVDPNN